MSQLALQPRRRAVRRDVDRRRRRRAVAMGRGRARCTVAMFDGTDYPMGVHPMVITPDGTGMWLGSNRGHRPARLVRLDLATGEETEVDSHPTLRPGHAAQRRALPSPLIRSRRTEELIGARYLGERQVIHAAGPAFRRRCWRTWRSCPTVISAAISSDESGQRWVVSPSPTTATPRHLFLRPRHRREPAAVPAVSASGSRGAGADDSRSRSPPATGSTLPSYLTLPVGVEPAGLPLVLLVHGGPWARDCWGFDPTCSCWPTAAMRCCRSTSAARPAYGKAFVKAAIGEFAGQDARRPDRRRRLGRRAGLRRPGPRRDLRRLLRRLRRAGRRHLHPGRLRRRHRLRRHLEPGELHAHPAGVRQAAA